MLQSRARSQRKSTEYDFNHFLYHKTVLTH